MKLKPKITIIDNKIPKNIKFAEKIKNGFLKFLKNALQIASVTLIVFFTAMYAIPVIGGELAGFSALTSSTHLYDMLLSWGFPMVFITIVMSFGVINLCKIVLKAIKKTFESRMNGEFQEK